MSYQFPDSGEFTYKTRDGFLDRHVFYNGKYISTELLTVILEDHSRPRPMTPEERAAFLSEYFADSVW
jgi:poly-gamma-glutamate synthesis protein (capsule biosynthesis protein)